MTFLAYAMVFAGSAIMVYNIVRYNGFIKRMKSFDDWDRMRPLILIPFALLVLFLIGYLAVGLVGDPDLVIGGILFGGSIYVLIVLTVIYRIVGQLREHNNRSNAMYDRTKRNLDNLKDDYLTVLRVNLTKDEIVERGGYDLRESDRTAKTFTELMRNRRVDLISSPDETGEAGQFTRNALLRAFAEGHTEVEERVFCRLPSGQVGFVKIHATFSFYADGPSRSNSPVLVEDDAPSTTRSRVGKASSFLDSSQVGEVWAFITERVDNEGAVNQVLFGKALAEQFDMITYLVDGRYSVVIGENDPSKKGSVFPKEKDGGYMQYLADQVAPVVVGDPLEVIKTMSSLGLNSVEASLAESEPYEVNIVCEVDGEQYHKRFVYYTVDAASHFYLLLKSDTTKVRQEERQRRKLLEEALEEARRASAAKTTFLSNMSHDIRTPMNAIVGYTEIARKTDDPQQIHEYLGKIDVSSKYLLALINDVLEMSRIESGKLQIELEEANLGEEVCRMRDMFDTQMGEKGVEFTVDVAPECQARVMCDKVRLNRVLLNLVSNAYKFTPQGGSVKVSLRQLDSTDAPEGFGDFELRVKDSGIGMTKEFADKVFEAFERERTSTVSGIQGTGLGMAITKRIVDAMGGSVEVETEQGVGTEFIVRLRLELIESSEEDLAGAAADGSSGTDGAGDEAGEVDFEGMRVLLAEDNEINREIACVVLEEIGFVVDTAEDGKQALDALVDAGPGVYDIVITDIQMPVMDGYEEARAIRALPDAQLAATPIVAMSANAFQEDKKAGFEAGMNGYVAKPIDVPELIDTLSRVLS